MFRHEQKPEISTPIVVEDKKEEIEIKKEIKPKEINLAEISELLEKNLKWSQIIYEQNRKINHKLIWAAIAGWLRLLIIVVPLILALIFLPSLIRKGMDTYGSLFGAQTTSGTQINQNSLEQLLKILPINTAEQEQLKAILK